MKQLDTLCVNCPRGCALHIQEQEGIVTVQGNGCPKGEAYGKQELLDPRRMLTSTVAISPALQQQLGIVRLPVISESPVRKEELRSVCLALKEVVVDKAWTMGDVVCSVGDVHFLASQDGGGAHA